MIYTINNNEIKGSPSQRICGLDLICSSTTILVETDAALCVRLFLKKNGWISAVKMF